MHYENEIFVSFEKKKKISLAGVSSRLLLKSDST